MSFHTQYRVHFHHIYKYICALPYQIAIKEGLKKRIEIEDEMSESDFDQATFSMEMGCMPFGATENAFFAFDDVSISTVVIVFLSIILNSSRIKRFALA